MKARFIKARDELAERYQREIRERAITSAKARIIEAGLTLEEMGEDDLEVIVSDEEEKLRHRIRERAYVGALALLGIGLI